MFIAGVAEGGMGVVLVRKSEGYGRLEKRGIYEIQYALIIVEGRLLMMHE
jgi:hypothetical protein